MGASNPGPDPDPPENPEEEPSVPQLRDAEINGLIRNSQLGKQALNCIRGLAGTRQVKCGCSTPVNAGEALKRSVPGWLLKS